MYSWKISKYLPTMFDENGGLLKEVWTEFQDIGNEFEGIPFTADEYFSTEDLYVDMLLTFVKALKVNELQVTDLEHRLYPQKETYDWDKNFAENMKKSCEEIFLNCSSQYPHYYTDNINNLFYNIREGQYLNFEQIESVLRLVLRNHFWCKLVYIPRLTIDYLGKYYIVISSDLDCAAITKQIEKMGLVVERGVSGTGDKGTVRDGRQET